MALANEDSELSQIDRDALARLATADSLPKGLEEDVVNVLRTRGLLRRPVWRARMGWISAILLISVGTFALGGSLGARRAILVDSARPGSEFLVLLYEDAGFDGGASGHERARVEEYSAWARKLSQAGHLIAAGRLSAASDAVVFPEQTGVRVRSASEPTGYFVITAADRDEATRLASTCPHIRHGGRVVVRPIV